MTILLCVILNLVFVFWYWSFFCLGWRFLWFIFWARRGRRSYCFLLLRNHFWLLLLCSHIFKYLYRSLYIFLRLFFLMRWGRRQNFLFFRWWSRYFMYFNHLFCILDYFRLIFLMLADSLFFLIPNIWNTSLRLTLRTISLLPESILTSFCWLILLWLGPIRSTKPSFLFLLQKKCNNFFFLKQPILKITYLILKK